MGLLAQSYCRAVGRILILVLAEQAAKAQIRPFLLPAARLLPIPGDGSPVSGLEIEPELRRYTQGGLQSDSNIGNDGAFSTDELFHGLHWQAERLGELMQRYAEEFNVFRDGFTRRNCPIGKRFLIASRHNGCSPLQR